MNIGARIKALREVQGLTQEELSVRMGGYSRANISSVEHGKRASLSTNTLDLFAKGLGVKAADLLTEATPQFAPRPKSEMENLHDK